MHECERKCERLLLWRLDRNRVTVLVAGSMVPWGANTWTPNSLAASTYSSDHRGWCHPVTNLPFSQEAKVNLMCGGAQACRLWWNQVLALNPILCILTHMTSSLRQPKTEIHKQIQCVAVFAPQKNVTAARQPKLFLNAFLRRLKSFESVWSHFGVS